MKLYVLWNGSIKKEHEVGVGTGVQIKFSLCEFGVWLKGPGGDAGLAQGVHKGRRQVGQLEAGDKVM